MNGGSCEFESFGMVVDRCFMEEGIKSCDGGVCYDVVGMGFVRLCDCLGCI